MKIKSVRDKFVMVEPESIEETGIMYWLSQRFNGKSIQLEFNTTTNDGTEQQPTMWLREKDIL